MIAANYAFSLGAGLHLIAETDKSECEELLEAFYGIYELGVDQAAVRHRLLGRLREMCGHLTLPPGGSLTFVTRRLPFGAAFPEMPSTHLFAYPDLGISIVNGFAAEQRGTRGANIAVLVDPGKVRAPEMEAAAKLLPARGLFVRGYDRDGATVRNISEMTDHFPYDLLIFATHCGDADGWRWTYKYDDSEGIPRTLVVDVAIGVARTDDPEKLEVIQYNRFVSLDGVDWNDRDAKKNLYVGTAIKDFVDRDVDEPCWEPIHKEAIPRVVGSAAMAMADDNYIAMPRSLASQGSPIIINNACVSWHELAARFTFSDARAYVGTLVPVADLEAEAIVVLLLDKYFGKLGITTRYVELSDLTAWEAAITPKTRLLFAETPSNPLSEVVDIQALAEIAHRHDALLAIDNCFLTPALQRPLALGADLVIHSATKYLDGQGRAVGGAVVGRNQELEEVFGVVRTCGPCLSPFNAWIFTKGLETLSLRMRAHCSNALALAQWLERHPAVTQVYYSGLEHHPQHALASRQQEGFGAVLGFEVKGGREGAWSVIDATRMVSITGNLGDVKTTITHPATTTHGRLSDEQKAAAGITQGLIRVAVGLESLDDIRVDLARGLDALA